MTKRKIPAGAATYAAELAADNAARQKYDKSAIVAFGAYFRRQWGLRLPLYGRTYVLHAAHYGAPNFARIKIEIRFQHGSFGNRHFIKRDDLFNLAGPLPLRAHYHDPRAGVDFIYTDNPIAALLYASYGIK